MGVAFKVLELQNLLYHKDRLMKWADFLYTDTNLVKLKVTLIIISEVWWKMGEASVVVGPLKWFTSQMI